MQFQKMENLEKKHLKQFWRLHWIDKLKLYTDLRSVQFAILLFWYWKWAALPSPILIYFHSVLYGWRVSARGLALLVCATLCLYKSITFTEDLWSKEKVQEITAAHRRYRGSKSTVNSSWIWQVSGYLTRCVSYMYLLTCCL